MISGRRTRAERSSAVSSSPIRAAEGESQRTFFAGNDHEYEDDKKQCPGEAGAKPRPIRR